MGKVGPAQDTRFRFLYSIWSSYATETL